MPLIAAAAPWHSKEITSMGLQLRDVVGGARRLAGLLALAALAGAAPAALALDPTDTPSQSAFGMLGPGGISVIVPSGDVTYIGGNFDELAAITGAFARLDATTARRIAPLAEAEFGDVRAS